MKVTSEKYREYLIKRLESLKELPENWQKASDYFEIAKQMDYIMKELYLLDDSMNKQFSDTGKE